MLGKSFNIPQPPDQSRVNEFCKQEQQPNASTFSEVDLSLESQGRAKREFPLQLPAMRLHASRLEDLGFWVRETTQTKVFKLSPFLPR